MIQIFFVLMVLGTIDAHAFFSYDSAASLMEQGRWDEAKQQLQKLLVDKPDAPDILYDAGVASYQTKDYKQARAYFNRVTQLPQTKVELKEQAHFNAGNAAAALKEYENAIKQYEAVLNIDKNNEKAKHNIETIKALMQRKQEPQNKEKDSKENKDKKEEKSSEEQKNREDNKKRDEENSGQQEKEKDTSQDSQKQKQQEKGNQEQQGAGANQDDQGKEAEDKQGQQTDKNKQEQESHEKAPGQKDTKQPTQNTEAQKKDQGQAGNAAQGDQNNLQQKLDAQLIRVLDVQEKKDAALNKRMINAAVGQSMGGAQGENCW